MRGVTIHGTRPGGPSGGYDALGNPIVTGPTSYTIKNCLLAPTGSDETAAPFGAQTITGVRVIVLRGNPDVRPADRLTFWDKTWQMEGHVGPWSLNKLHGAEFVVRRAS
jgi:hypothetical protein